MGIKERHERERESVRSAILDAARALFTTEGYHHVSIRKIAERIEYSPAAIYSYFSSKDDIFFALAEEGFQLMVEMGEHAPVSDSPLDTLRGRLKALYAFSVAHPEHCALMLFDRSVPRIVKHRERFRLLIDMRRRMAENLQRCVDAGELPQDTEPYAALRVLLTATQGAVAARLFNRLASSENGEALAHDVIELAIAGIRAGAPISFKAFPEECHLASEPPHDFAESSTTLDAGTLPPASMPGS